METREEMLASGRKAAFRAFVALAIFIGLTALLFVLDPSNFYLWAKAIHVMAVIAWMAGLLFLPRLYAYDVEQNAKPEPLRGEMQALNARISGLDRLLERLEHTFDRHEDRQNHPPHAGGQYGCRAGVDAAGGCN